MGEIKSPKMNSHLKSKSEAEQGDFFPISARKDLSIRLIKVVSFMVIFMAGVVLGFSLTSHFTPYFSTQAELLFPSKMYSTNFGKENSTLESFISPSNLIHDMTDDELFWRASLVPKKKTYPFKRVPKVAFMFMTRGPLPLLKLWEKFFKGHEGFYTVYVHSLPEYKLIVNETSPFYNRQIRSEEYLTLMTPEWIERMCNVWIPMLWSNMRATMISTRHGRVFSTTRELMRTSGHVRVTDMFISAGGASV